MIFAEQEADAHYVRTEFGERALQKAFRRIRGGLAGSRLRIEQGKDLVIKRVGVFRVDLMQLSVEGFELCVVLWRVRGLSLNLRVCETQLFDRARFLFEIGQRALGFLLRR